jgi:hypothetical protein
LSIIENTKEIADLIQKIGNVDLYRKIVELEGEIIELSRQKLQLEAKVDELQKNAKLKAEMRFERPLYFQRNDGTPFCPVCFEKDGCTIHLVDFGIRDFQNRGMQQQWSCPFCKNDFLATSRES